MRSVNRRVLMFNLLIALCLLLTLPVAGSQSEYAIKLHMGETEQEIHQTTVLPMEVEDEELLGWSSSSTITPMDLFLLPGVWYQPGSTVTPGADTPADLYAHPKRHGQFAVFDPTDGTLPMGGNMVVYGDVTQDGTMQITVPDGSDIQAPVGYVFSGWKTKSGTSYAAGTTLSVSAGKYIYLQAQWAVAPDAEELTTGLYLLQDSKNGCVITYGETNAAYVVTALYEQSGKMQRSVLGTAADGKVQTSVAYDSDTAYCEVFFLNSNYVPLRASVPKQLSK